MDGSEVLLNCQPDVEDEPQIEPVPMEEILKPRPGEWQYLKRVQINDANFLKSNKKSPGQLHLQHRRAHYLQVVQLHSQIHLVV